MKNKCDRCDNEVYKDGFNFIRQTKTHGTVTTRLCNDCCVSFLYMSLAVGLLKDDNIQKFIEFRLAKGII